jgi:hypothetical protein
MTKWRCNKCGIVEHLDIPISLGVQDCDCGGDLIEETK